MQQVATIRGRATTIREASFATIRDLWSLRYGARLLRNATSCYDTLRYDTLTLRNATALLRYVAEPLRNAKQASLRNVTCGHYDNELVHTESTDNTEI